MHLWKRLKLWQKSGIIFGAAYLYLIVSGDNIWNFPYACGIFGYFYDAIVALALNVDGFNHSMFSFYNIDEKVSIYFLFKNNEPIISPPTFRGLTKYDAFIMSSDLIVIVSIGILLGFVLTLIHKMYTFIRTSIFKRALTIKEDASCSQRRRLPLKVRIMIAIIIVWMLACTMIFPSSRNDYDSDSIGMINAKVLYPITGIILSYVLVTQVLRLKNKHGQRSMEIVEEKVFRHPFVVRIGGIILMLLTRCRTTINRIYNRRPPD